MAMHGEAAPFEDRAVRVRSIVASLRAGRAEAAIEACVAALVDDPADPALNELASVSAGRAGRHEDAVTFARRSLSVRPDHVPTLVLLGRALRALDLHEEAASTFDRAVRLAPGMAKPAFLLCATLLQRADPRAGSMIEGLLARFPHEASGWEEIGHVLLDLGKPQAALTCLTRAMRAAPRFALAMRIALILKDLRRPGEAASFFKHATELDPESVRAWFLLGLSLHDAGDGPGAAAAYNQALRLDPELAEAAVNLGTLLQDAGDLAAAKLAYGRAVRIRPDTFGRVAQAITSSPKGELWLDLRDLRGALVG